MSCSARLPVYTLLVAAFIPSGKLYGIISYAGLTLLSLYALGTIMALVMALVLKSTILKSAPPLFLMELPHYRLPSARSVLFHVGERAVSFLRKAGTVILGASIILWFLATYPRHNGSSSERLEYSFAGQTGKILEPVLRPLGFDWKIGIGLVTSMLQREMFVSTMGTIYNIDHSDNPGNAQSLVDHMRHDINAETGRPSFTMLTALCVMVYFVLSMQCLSTLAVVRREAGGLRWPAFQFAYMTVLAYVVTFIVYRGGIWLGLGG
jgi:ferrous iron transport protein B